MSYNFLKNVFFIGLVSFLVGCAAVPAPLASLGTSIGETFKSFTGNAGVQGCAGGALTAGGIGYLVDGKEGALKGAAVGCIAGAFVGMYIEKRREDFDNDEEALDDNIQKNEKLLGQLRKANEQLAKDITDYKEQIAALKASIRTGESSYDELEKVRQSVDKKMDLVKENLSKVQRELTVSRKLYNKHSPQLSKQDTRQWKQQLADLEDYKERLSEQVGDLSAMSAAI